MELLFQFPTKCCLNVFFSLSDCFAKDKGPWIIKPVASSRGRGIYLVSNVSDQQSLTSVSLLCSPPREAAGRSTDQSNAVRQTLTFRLNRAFLLRIFNQISDIISAVRTGMCWIFLPPVLSWPQPFHPSTRKNLFTGCPRSCASAPMHVKKEAQATVEIKRLELKWGHPEEQHLCPRPCDLKY